MKRAFLSFICILILPAAAFAQKIEVSVQANSGFSFLHGDGLPSESFLITSGAKGNYTENPYGNIQAATYGIAADLKVVIQVHLLLGVQAGYDMVRSRIDLPGIDHTSSNPYKAVTLVYYGPYILPVAGQTVLTNQFINVNPYLGFRVNFKKIALDITPGIDIAFGLSSHEKGSTKATDDQTITSDYDHANPGNIIRLRFDVKAYYNRFGIVAGYAHGLTEYAKDVPLQDAPNYQFYDSLIRLGLSYRIY